jgi:nitrous oxidase accessory protein NosD
VQGGIVLDAADRAEVVACDLRGGGIRAVDSADVALRDNRQRASRWGAGLELIRCTRPVTDGNILADDLTAIRLDRCADAVVTGNDISARWWGVHLDTSSGASVAHNEIEHTMRAVCVSSGHGHRIAGNTITSCDSAVLVEQSATSITTSDNTIIDCRADIFAWGADAPRGDGNRVLRPRDLVVPDEAVPS